MKISKMPVLQKKAHKELLFYVLIEIFRFYWNFYMIFNDCYAQSKSWLIFICSMFNKCSELIFAIVWTTFAGVHLIFKWHTFTAVLLYQKILGLPRLATILEHEYSSIIIDHIPVMSQCETKKVNNVFAYFAIGPRLANKNGAHTFRPGCLHSIGLFAILW